MVNAHGSGHCSKMTKPGTSGFPELLLRLNALPQPVDRRLHAFAAMRDAERLETHLDHAQRAKHRGSVHVSHMGDAECPARHFADPGAEDNAAFCIAIILQRTRIASISHQNRGHRVRALAWHRDAETEGLPFGPYGHGPAHRLAQQAVAPEYLINPLRKNHVERSAQREKQMLRRSACISLVVHLAV